MTSSCETVVELNKKIQTLFVLWTRSYYVIVWSRLKWLDLANQKQLEYQCSLGQYSKVNSAPSRLRYTFRHREGSQVTISDTLVRHFIREVTWKA